MSRPPNPPRAVGQLFQEVNWDQAAHISTAMLAMGDSSKLSVAAPQTETGYALELDWTQAAIPDQTVPNEAGPSSSGCGCNGRRGGDIAGGRAARADNPDPAGGHQSGEPCTCNGGVPQTPDVSDSSPRKQTTPMRGSGKPWEGSGKPRRRMDYGFNLVIETPRAPVPELSCIARASATVEAVNIVGLREICTIDLGPCPLVANHPTAFPPSTTYPNHLRYTLPVDFEPTSSHHEMMEALLPTWKAKIRSFDDIWDVADRVLARSSGVWAGGDGRWDTRGLFWGSEYEGFFFQAFRYAIATLYVYADALDDASLFTDASTVDRDRLRGLLDDPVFHFVVTPVHVCDYDLSEVKITSGAVSATRVWQEWAPDDTTLIDQLITLTTGALPEAVLGALLGALVDQIKASPQAFTLQAGLGGASGGQTWVSDGFIATAALADYHFWWAHRLYDWVESGNAGAGADGVRFLAVCCARAGLAEIVDIAGLLVHEIGHLGRPVISEWECSGSLSSLPQVGLWQNVSIPTALAEIFGFPLPLGVYGDIFPVTPLKCATMETSWFFLSVVKANLALPNSLLEGCARVSGKVPSGSYLGGAPAYRCDTSGSELSRDNYGLDRSDERHRFEFDRQEGWCWFYSSGQRACSGAWLAAHHFDLWTEGHELRLNWWFPPACDVEGGSQFGSTRVN